MHRDNQSTILALSNSLGKPVEQRYFDAWGNLRALRQNGVNVTLPSLGGGGGGLLIDRGYTGHEHLWTVGLIHMNGRIYDPMLRRFVSPDNYVQDPYNTQSYNRYAYVWNNPLMYTDPSGELGFLAVIAIAAAVAILTNGVNNIMNGIPFWYGMGKAAVMGAISGAISFGIGSAVTSTATSFIGKAALQAALHGYSGGVMSALEGGNFMSGFAAGAVSSIISSAIQASGTNFKGTGAVQDINRNYTSLNSFGKSGLHKVVMIAAGGLSGGFSSAIAGGNFWQGVKQGIITSGLNHAIHGVVAEVKEGNARAEVRKMNEEYRASGGVLPNEQEFEGGTYFEFGGDEANAKLYFKYASDNSKYEFGMMNLTIEGKNINYVQTSYQLESISNSSLYRHVTKDYKYNKYNPTMVNDGVKYFIHSHPTHNGNILGAFTPSGMDGDMGVAANFPSAKHYFYNPETSKIFQYNQNGLINNGNHYNNFFNK